MSLITIPARFLDVDGVPSTDPQNFGCLPRDDAFASTFASFSDNIELIPRSQWKDLCAIQGEANKAFVKKIKNQGQEGTCASNATTQAAEIIWNKQFGLDNWVEFSPIAVYRWIASSPRTGSNIGANLRQLTQVGALPVAKDENRDFLKRAGLDSTDVLTPTGYYQTFPDGWKTTAAHFQAMEAFDIDSFEAFATALLKGFPVVYGRSGHAITGARLVWDESKSIFAVEYANSWGPWGDKGYGYDSESYLKRAGGSYGAFALRAMKVTNNIMQAMK